jgi:hypothetical protein
MGQRCAYPIPIASGKQPKPKNLKTLNPKSWVGTHSNHPPPIKKKHETPYNYREVVVIAVATLMHTTVATINSCKKSFSDLSVT